MFINAAVQQNMRTLEIKDYPFTPEALAHSFRQVCLKNHPDHNNSPESHDKMIQINEAYNFLKDYADTNAGDAEKIPASIRDRVLHAKEELNKKIEKDMFQHM